MTYRSIVQRSVLLTLLLGSIALIATVDGNRLTSQIRPQKREAEPSVVEASAPTAGSASACEQIEQILRSGRVTNPAALQSLHTFQQRCNRSGSEGSENGDEASLEHSTVQIPPMHAAGPSMEQLSLENTRLKTELAESKQRIGTLEDRLRTVLRTAIERERRTSGGLPSRNAPEEPLGAVSAPVPPLEEEEVHSAPNPKGPCSIVRRVMGWVGLGEGC